MNYSQITWDPTTGKSSLPGFGYVDPFLSVKEGVILTPPIVTSIVAVRDWYQAMGESEVRFVSSGYRPPESQVNNAILFYLRQKGLISLFPEIQQGIDNKWSADYKIDINLVVTSQLTLNSIYWWQRGWSKLLSIGTIINPAYDAVLTEHHMVGAIDKIGHIYPQTEHATGLAYDISGGPNGPDDELVIIQKAQQDLTCKIRSLTIEHGDQDCVHVNVLV